MIISESFSSVAGFEANGGYLLGTDVSLNDKLLTALPTRDALLPAFMLLTEPQSISELIEGLPKRFTASDRIQNFAKEKSLDLINELNSNATPFLKKLGVEGVYETNTTDGLRITLSNGDIIHLRPSGNAPELRCYAEADSTAKAVDYVQSVLKLIAF